MPGTALPSLHTGVENKQRSSQHGTVNARTHMQGPIHSACAGCNELQVVKNLRMCSNGLRSGRLQQNGAAGGAKIRQGR